MDFQGKIVLITGASSGIGRETARLFAEAGATVVATARREDRLKELAEETKDYSGKILPLAADLLAEGGPLKMMEEALELAGGLDILVNNAGIMDDMSGVASSTDEMYERVFTVNVKAPYTTMQFAVKYFLEKGGGVIINIASLAGKHGARAGVVYTGSKHAVVGMSKNTGFLYAKDNIRCVAICPGSVETEVSQGEFMKNINQVDMAKIYAGMGTNPRLAKPSELAKVILFAASDKASFLNAQAITVDGGWAAY